jgi:hypothetical protein
VSLRGALVAALRDLHEIGSRHAIIGGLAVSARVEPRMTRDVDIVVAVADDAAAEAVVHQMLLRGYRIGNVLEQSVTGRLATTRLLPPDAWESGVVVDLLFASSGIEGEVADAAESLVVLKDTVAPVATVGHLIALKLLSESARRPQDAADLARLATTAASVDWAQARGAVGLIVDRGFGRGRDLVAALNRLMTG